MREQQCPALPSVRRNRGAFRRKRRCDEVFVEVGRAMIRVTATHPPTTHDPHQQLGYRTLSEDSNIPRYSP